MVSNDVHPVDIHVGGRIRGARAIRKLSREGLARAIGVTKQQIGKYETAHNRLSAGRLWEIAVALNMPMDFFFDNLEGNVKQMPDFPELDPEMLATARLVAALQPAQRHLVLGLLKELLQIELPQQEEEAA